MNEEAKNAESGRLAKEYAEINNTLTRLRKSLEADADNLIKLAQNIKRGFGPIQIPEGLDLASVADRIAEQSAAISEHGSLENRLRQAGLEGLIRR